MPQGHDFPDKNSAIHLYLVTNSQTQIFWCMIFTDSHFSNPFYFHFLFFFLIRVSCVIVHTKCTEETVLHSFFVSKCCSRHLKTVTRGKLAKGIWGFQSGESSLNCFTACASLTICLYGVLLPEFDRDFLWKVNEDTDFQTLLLSKYEWKNWCHGYQEATNWTEWKLDQAPKQTETNTSGMELHQNNRYICWNLLRRVLRCDRHRHPHHPDRPGIQSFLSPHVDLQLDKDVISAQNGCSDAKLALSDLSRCVFLC